MLCSCISDVWLILKRSRMGVRGDRKNNTQIGAAVIHQNACRYAAINPIVSDHIRRFSKVFGVDAGSLIIKNVNNSVEPLVNR